MTGSIISELAEVGGKSRIRQREDNNNIKISLMHNNIFKNEIKISKFSFVDHGFFELLQVKGWGSVFRSLDETLRNVLHKVLSYWFLCCCC